jgi:hypothetical protein
VFRESSRTHEGKRRESVLEKLRAGNTEEVFEELTPCLEGPPFGDATRAVIIDAVSHIIATESERGTIARVERSALDPAAQPYQNLIDRVFYAMAGLTPEESAGLERRLGEML